LSKNSDNFDYYKQFFCIYCTFET